MLWPSLAETSAVIAGFFLQHFVLLSYHKENHINLFFTLLSHSAIWQKLWPTAIQTAIFVESLFWRLPGNSSAYYCVSFYQTTVTWGRYAERFVKLMIGISIQFLLNLLKFRLRCYLTWLVLGSFERIKKKISLCDNFQFIYFYIFQDSRTAT